ncbi:MAG: hypothetical protein JNJ45_04100 [Chthonomonas sp.]|nr:hypothetical protein [Chthonomonas sp.]
MRSLIFALCVSAIGATAHASFDLAIMYDSTNQTFVRYDPVNRVVLGTFGSQYQGYFGNAHRMALDPTSPGKFLSMDVNGVVRQIDYSTGLLTASYHPGTTVLFPTAFRALSNGNLLRVLNSGATTILTRGSATPITTFATYSGYTTIDALPVENGNFVTLERSISGSNYLYHLFYRNSGGTFVSWLPNWYTSTAAAALRTIQLHEGEIIGAGHTSGQLLNAYAPYSAGSFGTAGTIGVNHTVDTTNISTLANGHPSTAYFVQNGSGGTRVFRMDLAGRISTQFDTTSLSGRNITDMVVVIAPEPGAFAGLALGALLLLRRKK